MDKGLKTDSGSSMTVSKKNINLRKPSKVNWSGEENHKPFLLPGKFDYQSWDRVMNKEASKEYGKYLLSDIWGWQWYNTLTFQERIHPEQADRYYKRWVRKLNENFYGKRFRRKGKGITWVRGLEFQKRGVIHFHSLFMGLPDFRDEKVEKKIRHEAMKMWERIGNRGWKNYPGDGKRYESKTGYARVYPYKPGACSYISKYVAKGGELDFFIGSDEMRERVGFSS